MTYDTALQELQQIISELEHQTIGIDELSDKIKRASVLIQFCKKNLKNVEINVENLLEGKLME